MIIIYKLFEEGVCIYKNLNLLYGDIVSLCKDVV